MKPKKLIPCALLFIFKVQNKKKYLKQYINEFDQQNINRSNKVKMQVEAIQIYRQRIVIEIQSNSKNNLNNYLQIISKVLDVDKELNPDQLKKTMIFDQKQNKITIDFGCVELKLLRSCVTGFLRHMQLVTKTIEAFQP